MSKVRKQSLPYDRLIFLTIILESLVGADSELTYRISHRTALLVGKDGPERGRIFEMSKKYYSSRSQLVHGSGPEISAGDLFNLTGLARIMILKFISLSENDVAITKKELVEKLDRAVVDDLRVDLKSKAVVYSLIALNIIWHFLKFDI